MTEQIRYESIHEPLDDEERELMDPDNWDWDTPVEMVFHEDLGFILPIRFAPQEAGRRQRLAHSQGMTTHEFIKQSALSRLPQEEPK